MVHEILTMKNPIKSITCLAILLLLIPASLRAEEGCADRLEAIDHPQTATAPRH